MCKLFYLNSVKWESNYCRTVPRWCLLRHLALPHSCLFLCMTSTFLACEIIFGKLFKAGILQLIRLIGLPLINVYNASLRYSPVIYTLKFSKIYLEHRLKLWFDSLHSPPKTHCKTKSYPTLFLFSSEKVFV